MEELPNKSSNPNINQSSIKTKPKSQLLETLKNFVFMFPLACIVFYQMKLLGHTFGEFITFPPLSVITYIFIGAILLMLLALQIMMRSIVYSTIASVVFIIGIFSAWFGDVYHPIIDNISKVVDIMQSAWTRKNIPYDLLMSGIMTTSIVVLAFIQFVTSLIVKSFFEMIFGKKWGDGRWMAYLGAIALLLGIQLSFNSYINSSNNKGNKLIWSNNQIYSSLENFITRVPGSLTYNDEYIWINNGKQLKALDLNTGKEINKIAIDDKVFSKGFEKANTPIVFLDNRFVGYSDNLNSIDWEIDYPTMTASDAAYTNTEIKEESVPLIPLIRKFVNSGKYMLVFYDFGKIGLYDIKNGKELWCNTIDQPTKVSRMFPDKYLEDYSFLENNSKLIISCQNGYIKSIDMETGKIDWEYKHNVSKIGGKAQRGYLSKNGNNFVSVFKTGEIMTLSYNDGHIVYKGFNELFSANASAYCNDGKANFITDDGLFYCVALDGGKIELRINALPNKAEIYPILQNNISGVYAHRDKVYLTNEDLGYSTEILSSKNRTFITDPITKGDIAFIGTLDGWVYCIDYKNKDVKFIYHVNGELMQDSLGLIKDNLLVKTKSNSIYMFKID